MPTCTCSCQPGKRAMSSNLSSGSPRAATPHISALAPTISSTSVTSTKQQRTSSPSCPVSHN